SNVLPGTFAATSTLRSAKSSNDIRERSPGLLQVRGRSGTPPRADQRPVHARDERRGRGQRLFLRRGIQSLALRRSPRQRGNLQARALPRGSTEENGRTASRPVLKAEKTGERKRKRSPQASPEGHHPKTQKPPAQTKAQEQCGAGSRRLGRPDCLTGAKPRNAGDSEKRHPKAANTCQRPVAN